MRWGGCVWALVVGCWSHPTPVSVAALGPWVGRGWQLRGKPDGSSRAECRALRVAACLVRALRWLHRCWCNDVTPAGAMLVDVCAAREMLLAWGVAAFCPGRAASEQGLAMWPHAIAMMHGAQENV